VLPVHSKDEPKHADTEADESKSSYATASTASTATAAAAVTGKFPHPPFPEIYFGGCCWGAAFYIGAYRWLWETYGPHMTENGLCFTGDSAGSVVALFMGAGMHPDKLERIYKSVGERSAATQPWYNATQHTGSSVYTVEVIKAEVLDCDPQAYQKLQGKFYCGSTEYFDRHRWHTSWASNADLLDTLRGSIHIPFYCHSQAGPLCGSNCVDGAYGFAGADLLYGDRTLFIGIDPHAEVTRSFTNAEMLYPALGEECVNQANNKCTKMQ